MIQFWAVNLRDKKFQRIVRGQGSGSPLTWSFGFIGLIKVQGIGSVGPLTKKLGRLPKN